MKYSSTPATTGTCTTIEDKNENNNNDGVIVDDDYFASENEAWILGYQNLLREKERILKRNDENDDNNDWENGVDNRNLQSMMMISRIARIANLQCAATAASAVGTSAAAAYWGGNSNRDNNNTNSKRAINIENLILHVQHKIDEDVDFNESMLKNFLPATTTSSKGSIHSQSHSNLVLKEEDLCTSLEIDAFFDDYPECNRMTNKDDEEYESDNSSDDDDTYDDIDRMKVDEENKIEERKKISDMAVDAGTTVMEPPNRKKNINNSKIRNKNNSSKGNSTSPLTERKISSSSSSSSRENRMIPPSSFSNDTNQQRSDVSGNRNNNNNYTANATNDLYKKDNNNSNPYDNNNKKRTNSKKEVSSSSSSNGPNNSHVVDLTSTDRSNNNNNNNRRHRDRHNDYNDQIQSLSTVVATAAGAGANSFEYTPASQSSLSRPSSSSSSNCRGQPPSSSYNHLPPAINTTNSSRGQNYSSNINANVNANENGSNEYRSIQIVRKNNNNSNNKNQSNVIINPYRRASSINHQQPLSHPPPPSSSSSFQQHGTINNKDAWAEHRNQHNPFQTAREVSEVEQNYPHRDPYQRNNHATINNNSNDNCRRPPLNYGMQDKNLQQHQQKQPRNQQHQRQYQQQYGYDYQQNDTDTGIYTAGGGADNSGDATTGGTGTSTGLFIPDSLKRKFQPPKKVVGRVSKQGNSNNGNGNISNKNANKTKTSNNNNKKGVRGVTSKKDNIRMINKSADRNEDDEDDDELPEELQHLDKELVKKIENEIMVSGDTITFDDIAGLPDAKATILEVVCWPMKRPDLFTGLRSAPNGLLLYGPPGTGKTLIGKAIAHESGATFFSISSSSLTSKWIGEGEKLVKTLFAVAGYRQPAVVFIDEIDSLLSQRKESENEASRRIKTEFLVQLDGTGTTGQGRVLIIGATNRPQEMDDAARRRFTKRLYIPLPEEDDRNALLRKLLKTNNHKLIDADIVHLAKETKGFSGADLKTLCTDAAMGPIRGLGSKALEISVNDVPPISLKHFKKSLKGTRPSVAAEDLMQYMEYDKIYGSKRADEDSDGDSDDDDE